MKMFQTRSSEIFWQQYENHTIVWQAWTDESIYLRPVVANAGISCGGDGSARVRMSKWGCLITGTLFFPRNKTFHRLSNQRGYRSCIVNQWATENPLDGSIIACILSPLHVHNSLRVNDRGCLHPGKWHNANKQQSVD